MDPKVRQTLLFLSFQVLFCIPIASTTQRDLLGSNDNSLVGKFFFNGLDEWIDRINLTLSSYEEMNVMERISDTCFDHLVHLLNSARDRHPWALRGEYEISHLQSHLVFQFYCCIFVVLLSSFEFMISSSSFSCVSVISCC